MRPFVLFFGGAEQQGWRRLLAEQNAPMAVSFRGLLRRLPKTKSWTLAERMAGEYPLLLDSGAHSFNSAKEIPDRHELESFAATYEGFVENNSDRPSLISEFDSVHLGYDWVVARRRAFYDQLEPSKFMPMWHAEWGTDVLREMAQRYEVIGLTATETTTGSNLTPILHQVARNGVHLHGVALTKPDILRVMPFSSAASTSWLSPNQYGDTIVWDGQTLHRYPKAYKDRARRQHKMLIERAGFDAEKIMADDNTEVLRFTIWSWLQQAEAIRLIRRRTGGSSFTVEDEVTVENGAQDSGSDLKTDGDSTVNPLPEVRNSARTVERVEIQPRPERVVIPGIGVNVLTSTDKDDDGQDVTNETSLMTVTDASGRNCDHCFVMDVCPQYRPHTACAYDIPVSADTPEQRKAIMTGVIKMQTQRVAFARMAEDANGGYPDPNLSSEIDRLRALMLAQHEIEDNRDSFDMTIRARGAKATMMERIFGDEAPSRHGQVIDVDPIAAIEEKVSLH